MCRFAHGSQELRSNDQSHLVKTLKFLMAENKILREANVRLRKNLAEVKVIEDLDRYLSEPSPNQFNRFG